MGFFLTIASVAGFAGLGMACAKPNDKGRTSFFLAFLAFLFYLIARSRMDTVELEGPWLIFATGVLVLALGTGLYGLVRADGVSRIPPLGAAVGAGALLFGFAQPLFEEAPKIPEVERKLAELSAKRADLEDRVDVKLPRFLGALERQATEARRDLSTADAAQKIRLEAELLEIAEQYVAAEREKDAIAALIDRIRAEERTLARLKLSRETFGEGHEELQADLDGLWKEASVQLSRPVGERLDGGIVDKVAVDRKLAELLNR